MLEKSRVVKCIPFFVVVLHGIFWVPKSLGEAPSALYQPCVACHGAEARGNSAVGAPALAGQQADYVSRQLGHFRDGRRGVDPADTYGAQMRAMSQNLSDAQIDSLANYLSQLPGASASLDVSSEAMSPPRISNGSDYYQANCGACHGGKAQGNVALNAPSLVLLDSAYLLRQMNLFQKGVRGTSNDDRYGKQMQLMSTSLPSQGVLEDVIAFIRTIADEESGEPTGS